MIKAILWDNDGVLVDTERLYFLATQYVLATVGIPLTTAQYIDLFLVQGKGA
jgi:beta-phosphoglucomutase-like phosphatase (HAD superfamily)